MIFRNIFSGFSCESKGDSSDEFYARSSSRVELLRFSDARSPENRHSGLGRRRNRGWNFYVDFLLVSLFLLYLYKTKKERLLVAGKAGSASGIRRTSGAEYGRRPAGFRPGRERSRSRITRQMKTILSLVALLAATAGLRGQGGASADDSGPAPTRCASGASKRPMPCSADYWPHTTIHGRPCPVSVFLSYAMHRAVTTVAAVAFCLPGSIWPILRRGRCVGAR